MPEATQSASGAWLAASMKSSMILGSGSFIPLAALAIFFSARLMIHHPLMSWAPVWWLWVGHKIELGSLSLELSYVECAKGEDLEGNQVPVLPLWWKGWSECQQGPACESQSMQSSVPSHWQHITLYRFIQKKVRRIFSTWRTAGRDRRSRNLLETLKMANITSNFKPEKKHQGIQLGWWFFPCVSVLEHVKVSYSYMFEYASTRLPGWAHDKHG